MKFRITITREEDYYVARCQDWPDIVAQGSNKQDALEKIKAIIIKKLDDGRDGGAAPKPHPTTPPPCGPIIICEELPEKSDAS